MKIKSSSQRRLTANVDDDGRFDDVVVEDGVPGVVAPNALARFKRGLPRAISFSRSIEAEAEASASYWSVFEVSWRFDLLEEKNGDDIVSVIISGLTSLAFSSARSCLIFASSAISAAVSSSSSESESL